MMMIMMMMKTDEEKHGYGIHGSLISSVSPEKNRRNEGGVQLIH